MVQEGKHETNRVYLLNNLLGSNVRNGYEDSQGLRSLCSRGSGKRKMKSIFCTAGGAWGWGENGFHTTYFQAPLIYSFEKDELFDVWMFQRQCSCIIHHCSNIYMKVILIL